MTYRRGDVVLVYYPHADLTTYKKRPALIVQADNIQTGLPQKLVAMITSNLARTGAMRIKVTKDSDMGKSMGIRTDSVVVADNLAVVENKLTHKKIGHCSELERINVALRQALGVGNSKTTTDIGKLPA
jgi:mRNA interferase MazF